MHSKLRDQQVKTVQLHYSVVSDTFRTSGMQQKKKTKSIKFLKKRQITANIAEIQKIITNYCEKQDANKTDDLEEEDES